MEGKIFEIRISKSETNPNFPMIKILIIKDDPVIVTYPEILRAIAGNFSP